jgi:hypothetical protein
MRVVDAEQSAVAGFRARYSGSRRSPLTGTGQRLHGSGARLAATVTGADRPLAHVIKDRLRFEPIFEHTLPPPVRCFAASSLSPRKSDWHAIYTRAGGSDAE